MPSTASTWDPANGATGPYGAPEIWGLFGDDSQLGPEAADVYAYCCLAYEVLTEARYGRLRVQMNSSDLANLRRELRRANQRSVVGMVGAALILSASAMFGLASESTPMFAGAPILSWVFGGIGTYLVIAACSGD